ncbi:MAG TPA: UDP-N-acetylmuramoyl-L-alanyl-D-glutamate--2,6-diaminopimelate ligase, partial [Candidatus Udaeobacter sp.]|nr:UDP-N-acetylmuramoyl-L-alanyl-D-glutamate--2,6-diaminopimelate ligase [Candidatus Udaeobacter sp.]
DHPSRAMKVVGVTGTNGKTTVTWMLESIFRAAGSSPGVVGTTGARFAGEDRKLSFTTPEAPELQSLLREMADAGVEAAALEVSSHALAQRRSYGLECDVAVFTNLSHDHLDYHGTMDAYLDAKLMLFDGRNGPTKKKATAVFNQDDPAGARVESAAKRAGMGADGFGRAAGARARLETVHARADGVEIGIQFSAREREGSAPRSASLRVPLLGSYNAWNAAAAWLAARAIGVDDAAILAGLESMPAVPGRLERVRVGQRFEIVVDYAHTPDALTRAIAAVREHFQGRVLLVFGCGGDRDRAKRPLMGAIAARDADLAWVTSDNPRSEDPMSIVHDIMAGAARAAREPGHRAMAPMRVEIDRRDAIAAALGEAKPGDAVLIAGKGHETTQTIGDRVLPFDDREVARELLRAARGA